MQSSLDTNYVWVNHSKYRLLSSLSCFLVLTSVRPSWWLWQQRIRLRCRRPEFNPWIRKIPWRRKIPQRRKIAWRRECYQLQYSFLENSMDREIGRLQSIGLQSVRHELTLSLSPHPACILVIFLAFLGHWGNNVFSILPPGPHLILKLTLLP